MTGINSITQAPGFDQARYDSLIQQAQAEKVDTGLVDNLLLNAVKGGKSFDQALAMVGSDVPSLPPPKATKATSQDEVKKLYGIPSPGALIMSATTEFAAEQRRMNQEIMWQETEAVAASIKAQAKEMHNAAVTQLVLGCVAGAAQIAMGVVQVGMSVGAATYANKTANAAALKQGGIKTTAGSDAYMTTYHSNMMKANLYIGAAGEMGKGASSMIEAGGQYVGIDMQARAKEMEADQEKMRAVRESVKNLDEGLRDLIRKSLAAQQEIQASTNQARARILA
ncbi:MAG: hypothetical protein FWG97_02655 [Deltaproteobacteria bacterium]|nr:hypothetical protein [Deltaproteobacteria bacterium]